MDFTHLIESETAKLRELHQAIHRALPHRERDERSRREWAAACRTFHAYVSPLDRYLQPAYNEYSYAGRELREFAIRFLELDPWFFRSGYIKETLLTRLKRTELSALEKDRLRLVLLDAVNRRGVREFRYYCRLAALIAEPQLIGQLESAQCAQNPARSSRAQMMLGHIRQHQLRPMSD